jgi:hypothetical protein
MHKSALAPNKNSNSSSSIINISRAVTVDCQHHQLGITITQQTAAPDHNYPINII